MNYTRISHTKIINLNYQLWRGMKNLNYLMDHILYQLFKVILNIFKKHGEKTDHSSNKNIMYIPIEELSVFSPCFLNILGIK